jgi:hypothetical protein
MSTGITIVSAEYGVVPEMIDVTSQVTSHIKDGELNLLVSPASLNVNDPAAGKPNKTLNVSYTINSGSTNTKTVTEGNTLHIIAPGQKTADGLVITKAEYGYAGNYTDVTDAIQSYVSNGSIDLKVSSSTAGIPDPNPNKKKSLKVTYTLNGSSNTETIDDGKKFTLSAPPLDAPPTKTPRQHALTGMNILVVNFGYFVSTFVVLLNIFACCRISLNWFNTFIFGFLVGLMPLSYVWAILPALFARSVAIGEPVLTDAIKNTPLIFGFFGI